jgi:hypothetical protein
MFARRALLVSLGLICLSQFPCAATLGVCVVPAFAEPISCNVLWFGVDSRGEEIPRLTALGLTFTGPNSIHPGSDFYWVRVFEWLCAGSTTPTENATWGRVKILYR